MLSFKRGFGLLTVMLALAGCGFQPVHGTFGSSTANSLQSRLGDVRVEVLPKDRLAISLSNEVNFRLNGGQDTGPKRYTLKIKLTPQTNATGIAPGSGLPTSIFYVLSAEYQIVDSVTQKTLHKGRSFARADYDYSGQRFANVRSQRDAENRAVVVLAEQLHHHMLGYFSRQPAQ